MPEYIPEFVPEIPSDVLDNMDTFTRSYLEAAEWLLSDEPEEQDRDGYSDDQDRESYTAESDRDRATAFSPEAVQEAIESCRDFQEANRQELDQAYGTDRYTEGQAGVDFWLTRNRHGAGFWDRGLGEIGKRLTEAAHACGECDTYVGDDTLIYFHV